MRAGARMHALSGAVKLVWASAVLAGALLAQVAFAAPAFAEQGSVYSCTVVPCYRHPVTGAIEDAGGQAAEATGLGMAQSCISAQGMLEQTAGGECYLTIRLGLMDYTSGHSFQVQQWGASGWTDPRLQVMASGADANGATQDVCIEVPSSSCVVRLSMYVEPMGRDVVFYCYPADFVEGVPASMTPAVVDESPATVDDGGQAADAGAADAGAASDAAEPAAAPASPADAGGAGAQPGEGQGEDADLAGRSMPEAQGLSLSTARDAAITAAGDGGMAGEAGAVLGEVGSQILVNVVSGLIVGVVLLALALAALSVLRKRWAVLPGYDDDDYSREYAHGE